jgi:DNA-binding CsgD family transcriptional regulator
MSRDIAMLRCRATFRPRMATEPGIGLTAREQEVLGLLSEGRSNKEIAASLTCSVRTVEFHISNLLRKVGASSRLELVAGGRRDIPVLVAPDQDPPLIELRVFSGVGAAPIGDTLVYLWTTSATLERWRWAVSQVEQLLRTHPEGVLCLSLIASTASPPIGSVRAQMTADCRLLGSKLRRFVGVPLGNSVWSGTVFTIARTTMLFREETERQTLASSIDQGLCRLLEATGPSTPPRRELERSVQELSRLLGVSAGSARSAERPPSSQPCGPCT